MFYRRPFRGGDQLLSYDKGDIFYVLDTLPDEYVGVWHVKKLNSKGEATETGFIPVEVRSAKTISTMYDVISIYSNVFCL